MYAHLPITGIGDELGHVLGVCDQQPKRRELLHGKCKDPRCRLFQCRGGRERRNDESAAAPSTRDAAAHVEQREYQARAIGCDPGALSLWILRRDHLQSPGARD